MNTSQRQGLRKKNYGDILILRILIGSIRLVYDLPSFLRFLVRGEVESKPHR